MHIKSSYSFLIALWLLLHWNSAFSSEQFIIVKENQKKGVLNDEGDTLIPVRYDDLGWSNGVNEVHDRVLGYKENNQWGLINLKNKRITPPTYIQMYPDRDDLIIAAKRLDDSNRLRYGVINNKGKTVIDFNYLALYPLGSFLEVKTTDRLNGLVNRKGKVILSPNFKDIKLLSENLFQVLYQNGKIGFLNAKQQPVAKFSFDSVSGFQGKYAYVYSEGKVGLVDTTTKIVLEPIYKKIKLSEEKVNLLKFPEWQQITAINEREGIWEYDTIAPIDTNRLIVRSNEYEMLVDLQKSKITESKNWQIQEYKPGIVIIKKNKTVGVLNSNGKNILSFGFDSIFYNEGYLLAKKNEKWTIWSSEGEQLTRTSYEKIMPISGNRFLVKKNDLWGFLDYNGEEIITVKYDTSSSFIKGKAKINYLGRAGFIDSSGTWLLKPLLPEIEEGPSRRFVYRADNHSRIVDTENKLIYITHRQLYPHDSSFLEVDSIGRVGLIDINGEELLPVKFDSISTLQGGDRFIAYEKDRAYLTDLKGNKIPAAEPIQNIYSISERLFMAKIGGKYGFVDKDAKLRIANRYDSAKSFHEGYAPVKLLGRWGYIDKREELVIQPHYDVVSDFHNQLAIVGVNDEFGLLDKTGEVVIAPEYIRIERQKNGRYLVYGHDAVGLISKKGKMLIYPKYEEIVDLDNGFVIVKRKNKYGLLTVDGINRIPMIYDQLIYDYFNEFYFAAKYPEWELRELK